MEKKSEGGRLGGWALRLCMCVQRGERESCKQMCAAVFVRVCAIAQFVSLFEYRVEKSRQNKER